MSHPAPRSTLTSGLTPKPALPSTGTSVYLRLLLEEIERTGSASELFWQAFSAALPALNDTEIERLSVAIGKRGSVYLHAVASVRELRP